MPIPSAKNPQHCDLFAHGECSGCTALHLPYEQQLSAKWQAVHQHLAPFLGGLKLAPVTPSPRTMGYRTSVKLCLQAARGAPPTIGLYFMGTRQVVRVSDCPAQTPGINALVAKLAAASRRAPAPFYNHEGRGFQPGRLKFLVIRAAPGGGVKGAEAHALILSHTGVPADKLRAWLASAGLNNVCAYGSRLTAADGNDPIGRYTEHLSGDANFTLPLGKQRHILTPEAFFQANHSLSQELIQTATAFSEPGETLLDLYGGFGAYSFHAQGRFQSALIVDGNAAAIAAARRTAKVMGLADQVKAEAAYCEGVLESMPSARAQAVTHVLVNPPRGGLSRRVAAQLTRTKFPRLQELRYVSCNAATLSRDLGALLKEPGVRLTNVTPLDMFPQTEHTEVVVGIRYEPAAVK